MTLIVIVMQENAYGNVEVSINGGGRGEITPKEKPQTDALIEHLRNNILEISKKAGADYGIFHEPKSKPQNQ